MVLITINIVLKVYHSLLNLTLSYADVWAGDMVQEYENDNLTFEPIQDEDLTWTLLNFLHGIDMPSIEDRSKPLLRDLDIIDFLKENNVYERTLSCQF